MVVRQPGLMGHSALWRYGFAVVAVGVAEALAVLSDRYFQTDRPVASFLAAIILTGWYAGTGPVVLATLTSVLLRAYTLYLPSAGQADLEQFPAFRLVWFLVFALLAAWFSAARRKSAEQIQAARDELEARVAARTAELQQANEALRLEVSERRRTEAELRERTAQLDELFDQAPEAIALLSSAEVVLRINRQFTELFGYTAAEASGRTIYDLVVPEERRDEARWIRDRSRLRGERVELETVRQRRDGSQVPVLVVATSINFSGQQLAQFVMYRDVSERKRTERALHRARARALRIRFTSMLRERTRLAREIHDTLLQGFTGVALKLVAVAERAEGQRELQAGLNDVIAWARRTLEDARRAVWDMRAPEGSGEFEEKLRAAAEDCVRDTGPSLEFQLEGIPRRLDPEVETVVFRIALEALANVVNHAGASTVRLTLIYEGDRIQLAVADDGQGFAVDPSFGAYGGHWGLLGMRERANQIGGRLSVHSTPGSGTEIILTARPGVGRPALAPA